MTPVPGAVSYSVAGGVATLTMDQPHNRNALTPALLNGLGDGLAAAAAENVALLVPPELLVFGVELEAELPHAASATAVMPISAVPSNRPRPRSAPIMPSLTHRGSPLPAPASGRRWRIIDAAASYQALAWCARA